jgi:DNA-binding GntR family transcriptional regulator
MESDFERLGELYDLREAFEVHSVGVMAAEPNSEDLVRLECYLDEMDDVLNEVNLNGWSRGSHERWQLVEAAFHLVILRATGNRNVLWAVLEYDLIAQMFGYLRRGFIESDHLRINQQHRELLEALRNKDETSARRLLTKHLSTGKARAIEQLIDNSESEPSPISLEAESFAGEDNKRKRQALFNQIWSLQREIVLGRES